MIPSIIKAHFKLKFNPIWVSKKKKKKKKKKWQRIYDLLNAETKPKRISEITVVYGFQPAQTLIP